MSNRKMHGMTKLPDGTKVGDLLPAFRDCDNEVHIGKPNAECASCRKPFNELRKRRKAVRIFPMNSPLPVAFSYDICGQCFNLYRQGGHGMDSVLASVESYFDGKVANQ